MVGFKPQSIWGVFGCSFDCLAALRMVYGVHASLQDAQGEGGTPRPARGGSPENWTGKLHGPSSLALCIIQRPRIMVGRMSS